MTATPRDLGTLPEARPPMAGDPSGRPDPLARARSTGRRLALPLAGGWASQVLVLVMLFVTGMAIHDLRPAGLVAGPGATAWLPWLMVGAGLVGGGLAATRLHAGSVDLLAAVVGTVVGLVLVAGVVSDASSLADQLRALESSVAQALVDLLVERIPSAEVSPFLLTLSALAWTTGAFAAISVGRYARASGAVAPIGAMLVVPVVLGELRGQESGQLLWLAIGVAAALLLVLRLNLERQRVRWLRRQVTGGRSVGRAFLGGGAALVGVVTLGAVALTAVGGSAPLAAGWERLGGVLDDWGVDVGRLRPTSGGLRGGFPDDMPIQDQWDPQDLQYFTASTQDGPRYWRGATYDSYDGRTWRRTDGVSTDLPAYDDLEDASADIESEDADGFVDVDATITFQDMEGQDLVAPQNPVAVDRDARLWTLGANGPFQVLEAQQSLGRGDSYSVESLEPDLDPASPTGLTAALLRGAAAGSAPDWVDAYLQLPERVGDRTQATATDIRRDLPRRQRDDRYALAHAVQAYLTSASFEYDTDLAGACRPGQGVTDCLLESRVGFCQQYATTMVVLLRLLDVPARYVVGYLPGVEVSPGEFEVDGSAAHAWVEVWFDGFGWVRFDPTPGTSPEAAALATNGQEQTDLPAGTSEPEPTDGPDETFPPDETSEPDETLGPDETALPTAEPSPSPGVAVPPADGSGPTIPPVELVAGGAGLAVGVAVLLGLLWFRRLPGGGPDRAWRGIAAVASRFGRGPTPSQTPYEYGMTLSRVVPRVAKDIRAVADAKVVATYGPDGADESSLASLRGSYARARTGLLALVLRRRR
ncbi:MAG: transglutaminaseTgpA domain-containing protein [Chloroflexota bacterium]